MRRVLLAPVVLVLLACGSSKLQKREAENDIKKDYPVMVMVPVPAKVSAEKGGDAHKKLLLLHDNLARTGWFAIQRRDLGNREEFTYQLNSNAPKTAMPSPSGGFQVKAAEAEFVRATRLDPAGNSAVVTYQVRLVKPTTQFQLFEALHPGVKIGETKDRHATYQKQGRDWILMGTDEKFMKAN
ncbi:MAG: hypothetical protein IPQ13_01100 [Holophagaceae bacterium]|nr:hypothetical protein [Holophagaceae bacterium]